MGYVAFLLSVHIRHSFCLSVYRFLANKRVHKKKLKH